MQTIHNQLKTSSIIYIARRSKIFRLQKQHAHVNKGYHKVATDHVLHCRHCSGELENTIITILSAMNLADLREWLLPLYPSITNTLYGDTDQLKIDVPVQLPSTRVKRGYFGDTEFKWEKSIFPLSSFSGYAFMSSSACLSFQAVYCLPLPVFPFRLCIVFLCLFSLSGYIFLCLSSLSGSVLSSSACLPFQALYCLPLSYLSLVLPSLSNYVFNVFLCLSSLSSYVFNVFLCQSSFSVYVLNMLVTSMLSCQHLWLSG